MNNKNKYTEEEQPTERRIYLSNSTKLPETRRQKNIRKLQTREVKQAFLEDIQMKEEEYKNTCAYLPHRYNKKTTIIEATTDEQDLIRYYTTKKSIIVSKRTIIRTEVINKRR